MRLGTGVGTNWRFWRFFDQQTTVSPKQCNVGPRLLLIINRKLHTRFRLVPKSTTLDDHDIALAMHLPLARQVSMPVIFCLLPSSSIVILVFYLFSTGISEQHV